MTRRVPTGYAKLQVCSRKLLTLCTFAWLINVSFVGLRQVVIHGSICVVKVEPIIKVQFVKSVRTGQEPGGARLALFPGHPHSEERYARLFLFLSFEAPDSDLVERDSSTISSLLVFQRSNVIR